MGKKLDKLFEMIGEIETAMMTTRRADGHLVSRAMATQERNPGADLWFVTDERSEKLREIENDPHVNLAYYKDRTREWVSVSGIATISRDRNRIRRLYKPDWAAWFGSEGDPKHGTAEDPRMVLIGVKIHTGFYLEVNRPQPVVLYELVKGLITKEPPKIGSVKGVAGSGQSVPAQTKSTRARSTKEGTTRPSASGAKTDRSGSASLPRTGAKPARPVASRGASRPAKSAPGRRSGSSSRSR